MNDIDVTEIMFDRAIENLNEARDHGIAEWAQNYSLMSIASSLLGIVQELYKINEREERLQEKKEKIQEIENKRREREIVW